MSPFQFADCKILSANIEFSENKGMRQVFASIWYILPNIS
jgi:hypothetical protein